MGGVAAVLLPPSILMGASLPVLARYVATGADPVGGRVGALYAVNAFGAVVGTLVTGFLALPSLGMARTLAGAAALNIGVGVVALAAARARAEAVPRGQPAPAPPAASTGAPPPVPSPRRSRLVLVAFALSGFGAMLLEVAWTRGLALVLGSSVYAFSLMLTGFLAGLAGGSAVLARTLRRRPRLDPAVLLAVLFAAAGVFTFATAYVLQLLPRIYGELHFAGSTVSTGGFAVQLGFALLVMFPTTFALGGVFPVAIEFHARHRGGVARSVGVVYASNTLGTIVGAAVAGFVLVPAIGVRDTVVGTALLELGLAVGVVAFVVEGRAAARGRVGVVLVAVAVLLLVLVPRWDVQLMNSGVYVNLPDRETKGAGWSAFVRQLRRDHRVVFAREGLVASVVVADYLPSGSRYLAVNGKVDASTRGDLEPQILFGHLPLLFHTAPQDILVIGLGSGMTVGSAATHPSVRRLRVVEVEAAMLDAARLFSAANGGVLDDPRVEVSVNDARNDLEFNPATYDVIVSEPSNPWMTVAANLFTEDFFRRARTRLRAGGVYAQWVQGYGLAPADFRSILAAFHASFPDVVVFELSGGIDYVLLGSGRPLRVGLDALAARMAVPAVADDLARVGVRAPGDLLGRLSTGRAEVARLAAGAERNTDDNARVEFSAPRSLGLETQEANRAMLSTGAVDPLAELIDPIADAAVRDGLRLDLARAWLHRGLGARAANAARLLLDGPRRAEAAELLEQADSAPR